MLTKDDLEQFGKLLDSRLQSEREHTRKLVREEIQVSEQRVKQAIVDAQEDTIKAVSGLVHEGYAMHEKRIRKIEEHLGLPHPQ